MKALLVAVSGFLAYMYLSAIFAASQRMPAHGGTTAQGSERMHATSSSKVEVAMARSTTTRVLLAQNKQLSDKLSALLRQQNPPVADLQAASQGFNMLGVFVTAVHISDNLSIPFDQLKTAVQTSGDLWKAIHMLKPDADVKAEVWEAARQASDDLEESYRLIGQSSSPSI